MSMNALRALGRWLFRKPAVERREILDDDGSIIAVSVGRPLTTAQRQMVDDHQRGVALTTRR